MLEREKKKGLSVYGKNYFQELRVSEAALDLSAKRNLTNGIIMQLSRSYPLIVAPRKFDVLKTNMLILRTSNF